MSEIRIQTKMLGGFGAALLVAMAVGGASYWSSREVGARLDTISDMQFPTHRALADIQSGVRETHKFLSTLAMSHLTGEVLRSESCRGCHESGSIFNGHADAALAAVTKGIAELDRLPQTPVMQRLWPEARTPLKEWLAEATRLRGLLADRDRSGQREGTREAAAQLWATWISVHQLGIPVDESLSKINDAVRVEAAATHQGANEARRREGTLHLSVLAVGALLMVVLAFLIGRSINDGITRVVQQSTRLSDAAAQGRLDLRGDEQAVPTEFRPIIRGMNATVDAIATPLRMAVDNVDRISHGDLPSRITEQYHGEFDRIAKAINAVIDVVNLRNGDIRQLTESALAGRLTQRADTSKYTGYNGKMVGGLNAMLDAAVAPMQEATEVLERLARRDLSARVKGEYQGDHARIKNALNATAEALEEALAQVAQASNQVSAAAGQIASSSQALASGASEQAAALEETSSSLEAMASGVKHAADNAQHANALAQSARAVAGQGAEAMNQMTSAMLEIRASAEGTSQIIKDINDIAFQTNLLALNAAVEAARAGVAGRGFAVVAEEVRSLALRSKEAANKTEALIRESVRQTGEGDATAKLVSSKLVEITGHIAKVSDIVSEIAASAGEQASGIEQVTKAVAQMNHVTQQNAASAEESSSAAAELSGQSQELAAMVGSFQIARRVPAVTAESRASSGGERTFAPARKNGVAKRPAAPV